MSSFAGLPRRVRCIKSNRKQSYTPKTSSGVRFAVLKCFLKHLQRLWVVASVVTDPVGLEATSSCSVVSLSSLSLSWSLLVLVQGHRVAGASSAFSRMQQEGWCLRLGREEAGGLMGSGELDILKGSLH